VLRLKSPSVVQGALVANQRFNVYLFDLKCEQTSNGLMLSFRCPECNAWGFTPWHHKSCRYYPHGDTVIEEGK
jgi:hypothetical protein